MKESVKIGLVGDLMLGGGVLERIERHGPIYPFKYFADKGINYDILFCNLECTLSRKSPPPNPNKILLHSSSNAVEGLRKSGINIVSLANNHAFDYGVKAFKETKNILETNGIRAIGAGDNIREASKYPIIEVNGIRLAFMAYCSKESGCRHFATDSKYGVAEIKPKAINKDIEKAKLVSDVVIVSLHWGEEFRDYPAPKNINIARSLIEAGATIVLGHHAHVFQGYEKYMNGVIIYDLGSFVFGDIIQGGYKFHLKKKKHREGIICECKVGKEGLNEVNFIPSYINADFQVTVEEDSRRDRIIARFLEQSDKIGVTDYAKFYKKYVFKMTLIERVFKIITIIQKGFQMESWRRLFIKVKKRISVDNRNDIHATLE